jgi:hypothetical protein
MSFANLFDPGKPGRFAFCLFSCSIVKNWYFVKSIFGIFQCLKTVRRKYRFCSGLVQCRGLTVAPHAGAWIETGSLSMSGLFNKVAPHAGAWIETL